MLKNFKESLAVANNESQNEIIRNFINSDLGAYISNLDSLISEINSDGLLALDGKKKDRLKKMNDEVIRNGERILEKIDNKVLAKKFRDEFRRLRPQYFYSSEIMDKGFKKYRGYPGDYEMMNYVYGNQICSETKVGKYFDQYFIENAYAQAVRGRKNKMVDILDKFIKDFKGSELDILNLPCGSARDIKELIEEKTIRTDIKINIVCVDQDQLALDFAQNSINNKNKNINISFVQGNILNYVRHPKEHKEGLGDFDLVYSIGLADYLPDKMLQNMINFSWNLLKPKSAIIYAFKIETKDPFAPLPPKWFCDWLFISRDEKEALNVIKNSNLGAYKISNQEWEETGRIVFYTVAKQ